MSTWNAIAPNMVTTGFNQYRSPSLLLKTRQRQTTKTRANLGDDVKIETKTTAQKINITWNINKQTLDIANCAAKGDKKGVIGAALEYSDYLFNLELCVPGWRRSQIGFSAFYLTVPKKTKNNGKADNIFEDEESNDTSPDSDTEEDNEFVARYTVSFGSQINKTPTKSETENESEQCTRTSSIRNDFDLGVGFPNFTEISTLLASVVDGVLVFKIELEIFSCDSTIKSEMKFCNQKQSAEHTVSNLLANMYYKKLHCDTQIIADRKRIDVHKCVLTSASSVFASFFSHSSHENATGTIALNFPADIVQCMVGFLYRGVIDFEESNAATESMSCRDSVDDDHDDQIDNAINKGLESLDDEECYVVDERKDSSEIIIDNGHCSSSSDMPEMCDLDLEKIGCPKSIKKLLQLFQIAECYEINDLLVACCHKLYSYLSINTSCIFLIYLDKFAHVSETKRIRDSIWDFISQNIKQIKKTNGYYYLLKQKPLLLDQLIDKIMHMQ